MTDKSHIWPRLGVIEGFYGQPWPQASRLQMMAWLPALGLDHYIYAPKADPFLRKRWQERWPSERRKAITAWVEAAEAHGLSAGLGLSPYALYQNYGGLQRERLRERVQQISDTGASLLALLFDDMPGELGDLAARQAEIAEDVRRWSDADELLVCPTYYSDDPILDRVFGQRPANYLEELGRALPDGVGVYWTGPQVCSAALEPGLLPGPQARGGAPLALWDNYPVNDSKQRCEHLYLQPLEQRDEALANVVRWHCCNAMNQPALSLPALSSLPAIYGRAQPDTEAILCAAGIDEAFARACLVLANTTVGELPDESRRALVQHASAPTMAGRELAAFIAGEYRFDPNCLTD